ncbi:MAG: hypothetical protein A3G30_02190 [Chlamydiae bacterium RIFCSPLOWO2_12_FULL_49_12]|nr:MAG: hypothetical protein A3D18_00785 [Chlamydiae bacterium RIFCSPHIGHO2_02_FULL_49_29]OGN63008.1 MAG: hypothetical protein A3E26_02230 [Chlamydiae bacterium RIFCSPHIGHO2_12_FULL_49_32]OGN70854.1 MAG: hypothetical protein A3G30_02190 [Chlamydiae bacterium RIFCSPLOWO2_12_FULL_49_12]OGN71313.1 MAG: hypothetical protein A3I15_00890 [Chlamydiae bacterium RIFCSPLOWO2_02_FULL_49_12]
MKNLKDLKKTPEKTLLKTCLFWIFTQSKSYRTKIQPLYFKNLKGKYKKNKIPFIGLLSRENVPLFF